MISKALKEPEPASSGSFALLKSVHFRTFDVQLSNNIYQKEETFRKNKK